MGAMSGKREPVKREAGTSYGEAVSIREPWRLHQRLIVFLARVDTDLAAVQDVLAGAGCRRETAFVAM